MEQPTRTDIDWSPRQREVLDLLARGKTNGEIARELGISLDGAKWHLREIFNKLGVDSREEAASYWRNRQRPVSRLGRLVWAMVPALGIRPAILAAGAGAAIVAVGALAAFAIYGDEPGSAQPDSNVVLQQDVLGQDTEEVLSGSIDDVLAHASDRLGYRIVAPAEPPEGLRPARIILRGGLPTNPDAFQRADLLLAYPDGTEAVLVEQPSTDHQGGYPDAPRERIDTASSDLEIYRVALTDGQPLIYTAATDSGRTFILYTLEETSLTEDDILRIAIGLREALGDPEPVSSNPPVHGQPAPDRSVRIGPQGRICAIANLSTVQPINADRRPTG